MKVMRSVSSRLFLLSVSILVVLVATAAILGDVVRHENRLRQREAQQARDLALFHSVQHALSSVRLWQGNISAAALMNDRVWQATSESALAKASAHLESQLAMLAPLSPEAVEAIQQWAQELALRRGETVAAIKAGKRAAAETAMRDFRAVTLTMEGELAGAERRVGDAYSALRTADHDAAKAALRWALYCIALTLLLGLLLALTISRSLVRPLRRIVSAVRRLTAGESNVALPPPRPDEFGDMTVALRQFQDQAEKLRVIAYRDPLTGLANRAKLEEGLNGGIVRCARGGTSLALLFLDLDNFKSVNESLGHSAGDRFLREAARRLQRLAPETALISRYSGDKFTVLVDGFKRDGTQQTQLRNIAGAILRGMSESYRSDEDFVYMTVSIGIAVYPMDGQSAEQLVSAADAAMYLAKRSGRNNLQFASPDLTDDARRKLLLAGEIRRGLAAGEFTPFYQPIIDVRSGQVAGAEALLRWHHPQRGIILPGEFVRVAEDAGLIGDLGERCLTMAYEQALRWCNKDRAIPIAVNLSARQLQDQKILNVVQQLQAAHELSAHCLEFEITESAVMERPELSQQTLQEIRRRGHKLSIDDFGTGHSALGYLQRFPIDRIKIDRSFVECIDTSRQSRAIVSATLALAENLGLDVIAEGVETQTQLQQMTELGCSLHQGYFFAPALPAEDFDAWLRARN
ncbi:MAG TPA: EAL domain-containing protein [Verrucomicrobiae bacterium]|nr:EAL domain-containing protein [Verrucomicrobiae bacterium]